MVVYRPNDVYVLVIERYWPVGRFYLGSCVKIGLDTLEWVDTDGMDIHEFTEQELAAFLESEARNLDLRRRDDVNNAKDLLSLLERRAYREDRTRNASLSFHLCVDR